MQTSRQALKYRLEGLLQHCSCRASWKLNNVVYFLLGGGGGAGWGFFLNLCWKKHFLNHRFWCLYWNVSDVVCYS